MNQNLAPIHYNLASRKHLAAARYFIQKGSKVYCGFLDASKAFDKVLHNGLFCKMMDRNISMDLVCILRNWYSKLYSAVLWNGTIGSTFSVLCGVRQGGVLSQLLFNIYIDDLIVRLSNSGFGVYIGNVFSGCIMYADDIALVISVNCRGLSKMLEICEAYGRIWDIQFNPQKSQLLTIGSDILITAISLSRIKPYSGVPASNILVLLCIMLKTFLPMSVNRKASFLVVSIAYFL